MRSTTLLLALLLTFGQAAFSQTVFTDARDQQSYGTASIGELQWMTENLRFETPKAVRVEPDGGTAQNCGLFYPVSEALDVCPQGWRLPREKEVRALIKSDKKGKLNLMDTLKIELCGRIDSDKYAKSGAENTFWLEDALEDGHIIHWHTFGSEQELHSHNVVVVDRKFPVRCVRSAQPVSD